MNELELAEKHPEAFKALPECYQADSCLEFWVSGQILYARPKVSEINILGNWNAVYTPSSKQWSISDESWKKIQSW